MAFCLFAFLSTGVKIVSDLRSGGLSWSKFAFAPILPFVWGGKNISNLRSGGLRWSNIFHFTFFPDR